MVTQEGKNLIFILSLPRSGSTLLSLILGGHSEVYCPPEPWFLLRLAEVYGEPTSEKIFDDYYASLATKAFMSKESFSESARAFSLQTYNDSLEKEQRRVFVDKTPRYYHILDFIDQLFPKAKKVWLKRNPLDVAASIRNTWHIGVEELSGRGISPAFFDFALGLSSLARYFEAQSPFKYEIKYEEVICSPEDAIRDLCSFCEIPFEKGLLKYSENKGLVERFEKSVVGDRSVLRHNSPHTASIDRWKEDLSQDELAGLIRITGNDIFTRMGYEETSHALSALALDGSSIQVSPEPSELIELFHKTRFGVIYRDWENLNSKINGLNQYIEKLHKSIEELHVFKGYLESMLQSRYLNLGWKLGIAKKPAWVDKFINTQKP